MDVDTFERLVTDAGQTRLAQAMENLRGEDDILRTIVALERSGADAGLARAAVETALLRRRATAKFPDAARMFFVRDALEQASDPACSAHRAIRFRGYSPVADLGCGIGGDTIALSTRAPVLAVDRDALRLRMARANVAVADPSAAALFLQANWAEGSLPPMRLSAGAAVFCDPSRREAGRRVFSVRAYAPPLSQIDGWRAFMPGVPFCIKASPGIKLEEIRDAECEAEFLSVAGELKEAVLWYGAFRSAMRRATRLPDGISMTESAPESDALSAPQEFLYEPDPSILRAGLVRQLAAELSAARIDPQIAYLTASSVVPTAWARTFHLEEAMPFGLKRLREWLRMRGVGRVTVKKRGSPLVPEELEHQLRLRGDNERVVFLTRVSNKPYVLIGNEIK
jgi:hypothetical protein